MVQQVRRGAIAGLLLLASGVAGCTHLEVNRFEGEGTDKSRSGYAYMLDYTQYEVTVTRSLLDCPAGAMPTIKVEATAIPSLVPDGSQVYVINPESLINAFKTTDISVDYKDGRLVGLNATIEDKSADVVRSVAATAGKIALLAGGFPMPVDGGGMPPVVGCSPEAVAKLASKAADKKLLEAATSSLDAGKSLLTDLTTRYAAAPTGKLARGVDRQKAAVAAGQKTVDEISARLKSAGAWLSRSKTATWPETSSVFASDAMLPLDALTIREWFDPVGLRAVLRQSMIQLKYRNDPATGSLRLDNDGASGNAARLKITMVQFRSRYPRLVAPDFAPASCTSTSDDAGCLQFASMKAALASLVQDAQVDARLADVQLNAVSLHIAPRGSYGAPRASQSGGGAKAGLRYRVPAASWLYVCEGDGACAAPDAKERVVLRLAGTTAQLGTVFNLPFSSPAFASGGVSMAFDDQGRLLKAGLKRTNSSALAVADSVAAIADQAVAYDKAARGADLADLKNAAAIAKAKKELADAEAALVKSPKASLEEELALLEATRKVEDARALVGPNRTKELQNEIALAKLEIDLAEQRKKQQEDPSAAQDAVKAQYDADTAVLNAQKAKLEAEAAVLAAERALIKARAEQ